MGDNRSDDGQHPMKAIIRTGGRRRRPGGSQLSQGKAERSSTRGENQGGETSERAQLYQAEGVAR